MVAALPTLIYNEKTRIGNEAFIYYNLGKAVHVGSIVKTASGSEYVAQEACAGDIVAPTGGFMIARVARKESDAALVIEDGGGTGVDITIAADAQVGYSIEMKNPSVSLSGFTGFTMTGGGTGDTVDLMVLPTPDDDVLICYDRGFSAQPGTTLRPVPRKNNPVDHYVNQRPENTINLSELTVNNRVGLRKIRGRDVTLIVKLFPDNIGTPCEIQYYTNCRLNMPVEIPAEGNDSVTINATGNFNKDCIFAAEPA